MHQLDFELSKKLNALARAAGLVSSLAKIRKAWNSDADYLRPKEIMNNLAEMGVTISSSDLSILLREPALCGLVEKDVTSPRYRLDLVAIEGIEAMVKEFAEFAFQYPVPMHSAADFLGKISAPHLWAMICVLQDGKEHSVLALADEVAEYLPQDERRLQQPQVSTRLRFLQESLCIIDVKPSGKYRYYYTTERFPEFAERCSRLWHPICEYFLAAYCC